MYFRDCPQCNKELNYSNLKNKNQAERKKILCKECALLNRKYKTLINNGQYSKTRLTNEQVLYMKTNWDDQNKIREYFDSIKKERKNTFKKRKENALAVKNTKEWYRKCPKCNSDVVHKNKRNRDRADKNKTVCAKCRAILFGEKHRGENNPFFGKTHTKKTIDKIKKTSLTSEKRKQYLEKIKSEEHREMLSDRVSGENNPRYGRGSLYDIWLEKYGEDEAKRRDIEYKEKVSLKSSGKNNNMYGKPSPQGSGNGWSGWYKGWFFRSFHELSYMINVIEKENLRWETAEKRKYKIKYIDFKGEERNYFPDFLINGKKLVEVKPERLKNSKTVIIKSEAAEKFCKKSGYKFEIVTPTLLMDDEIKSLYLNKEIKFTERYEKKIKKRFNI